MNNSLRSMILKRNINLQILNTNLSRLAYFSFERLKNPRGVILGACFCPAAMPLSLNMAVPGDLLCDVPKRLRCIQGIRPLLLVPARRLPMPSTPVMMRRLPSTPVTAANFKIQLHRVKQTRTQKHPNPEMVSSNFESFSGSEGVLKAQT